MRKINEVFRKKSLICGIIITENGAKLGVFQAISFESKKDRLDLHNLNLDGTHILPEFSKIIKAVKLCGICVEKQPLNAINCYIPISYFALAAAEKSFRTCGRIISKRCY